MRPYKPPARVASQNSRLIDEVDGVPTTHTQRGRQHSWTITDGLNTDAAFPVTAKKGIPAKVAVPIMCALVLIAMTAALASVLDGHPNKVAIVGACYGLLLLWFLLLLVPVFMRSR